MRGIVLGALLALLGACASPTPQTDALTPENSPTTSHVEGVPFIRQETNHCGPASLAMVMAHAGQPRPVAELAAMMVTPGKAGSFQSDLVGAARREGMMAVVITGMPSLLAELAAGHPVIVLHNLGPTWLPNWHYEVVWGHDLAEQIFRVHSGPKQALEVPMRKFERRWQGSTHWGLVVLPPGQLSASGTELEHATAAVGLELAARPAAARLAYAALLTRWPTSLPGMLGLANTHSATGDHLRAAPALRRAVKIHPNSPVLWHNLSLAEGAQGDAQAARRAAAKAVNLVKDTGEEARYLSNLERWL